MKRSFNQFKFNKIEVTASQKHQSFLWRLSANEESDTWGVLFALENVRVYRSVERTFIYCIARNLLPD